MDREAWWVTVHRVAKSQACMHTLTVLKLILIFLTLILLEFPIPSREFYSLINMFWNINERNSWLRWNSPTAWTFSWPRASIVWAFFDVSLKSQVVLYRASCKAIARQKIGWLQEVECVYMIYSITQRIDQGNWDLQSQFHLNLVWYLIGKFLLINNKARKWNF